MSDDPLTMDADDLHRLPRPERMALVDWANAITGPEVGLWIEAVTLGEGVVRVRHAFTDKDGPVWDRGDLVKTYTVFVAPQPPPAWKPLR